MEKHFKNIETFRTDLLIYTANGENISLSEIEVLQIVREWYCGGLCPDILQDVFGNDLEEILDEMIEEKINNDN